MDDFNIITDNDTLNFTEALTFLGLDIDGKLNFDSHVSNNHVSNMLNKAGRQLNVLQRLKCSLDYISRLSLSKIFMVSNFNYCPVVWMFTSKSLLSKLEDIQKQTLRFVLDDYESDYNVSLDKTNVHGRKIMTLGYLTIEAYKSINYINPKWMTYLLLKSANITCKVVLL